MTVKIPHNGDAMCYEVGDPEEPSASTAEAPAATAPAAIPPAGTAKPIGLALELLSSIKGKSLQFSLYS